MKLYSYAMPKSCGLAPNPHFDYCTLAIGKPIIRKCAQQGDWIAVFGSADTALHGKLVILMRVDEILTFDEYWEDERFRDKRPAFDKGTIYTYGDNIYHRVDLQWVQEKSLYSTEDESANQIKTKRDTRTNRVLIASEYYYFGDYAIEVPEELEWFIERGVGHSVYSDERQIEALVKYIKGSYSVERKVPY